MDAANLLKPMLARGELRCIGATTLKEYRLHVEKDAAFERRFQPVHVSEPTVPATVSILRGLKERYENHHGIRITDAALVLAAKLADRYIQNRFLPDKAIDLVDEACAFVRVQLDSRPERIDQLERQILQLEIEKTALQSEKDDASKKRLQDVQKEISTLQEELRPLQLRYEEEKHRIDEQTGLQNKVLDIERKISIAIRERDMAKAADLQYGALPEVQLSLKEVSEKLEKERQKTGGEADMVKDTVDENTIAGIVSKWTGIPVAKLTSSEKHKLLHLADTLHGRVIGQDEAVEAVSEAILRSRSGLARPNQPMGSFLFLGPTGVGKTELAKALAFELFDDDKHIVRIDMSEYMEQHSVARLIGAPPGYVGHDEGGQLTEAVRRRQFQVVLFDEVEKAHPSVLNILLQVMDDGRLTDSQGRTVDFTNTVIILTSNLGAEHLQADLQLHSSGVISREAKEKVMRVVRSHFRPEFLNRLDDTVIFHPLGKEMLREIMQLQMKAISDRLKDRNVEIKLTESAIDYVIATAFVPEYGARPIRRFLEKYVTTEISKMLIAGTVDKNCVLEIKAVNPMSTDISQAKLIFNVIPKKETDTMDVDEPKPSRGGRRMRSN